MEAWQTIWKTLFLFAVTVFAGMAVWVTIGGWIDLKRLFRRLEEDAKREDGP